MPYCTSYFKFLFEWFWSLPEQNKDFAIQNIGEAGVIILWALLTVFLVYDSEQKVCLTGLITINMLTKKNCCIYFSLCNIRNGCQ